LIIDENFQQDDTEIKPTLTENTEETIPEQVNSEETIPENVNTEETIPDNLNSEETIADNLNSEETIAEHENSEETIPEETIAELTVSEESIAEQVNFEEKIPEEVITEEVITEETIPDNVNTQTEITEETIPELTVSEEIIPEFSKNEEKKSPYEIFNEPNKLNLLCNVNQMLNLDKSNNNTIIFVYSPPKVGSTSIVSSLRIYCLDIFDVIHIHDEEMLRVLGSINDVSINEIILYNKFIGKNVYVIDIYRSPIERKISTFFEKIGSIHFNNSEQNVNNYEVNKIINRFNKIFPYLAIGDHFMDRYNIDLPDQFNFNDKYLLIESNGIKYIKLRLKDSHMWGTILSQIINRHICVVNDYQSTSKPIRDLYYKFKNTYKIPINLLDDLMNCKYLNYYYSPEEKTQYYNEWLAKSSCSFVSYSKDQFKLYEEISMENCYIDYIQQFHYMDEGCKCKACRLKRAEIANKINHGIIVNEKIIHIEAKTELIQKRNNNNVNKLNQLKKIISNLPKKTPQKLTNGMKTIGFR
jgi:hypothetical protein